MLVKACLNGARSRREHPAIPITPDELAGEARGAVNAGAAALHVHPRGPDGAETLDPGVCAEVLTAIRTACPGVPVGLTTIARIEPDLDRRLEQITRWAMLPDFVSVNFYEPGADALCAWCAARGVGIEAGLLGPADVEGLAAAAWCASCVRVLVEAEEPNPRAALRTAAAIEAALDAAGITAPRLHHGSDRATWTVIDAALDRGRDVRIGFEDTLVLPDGATGRSNRELVAAAVGLARRHGLEPRPALKKANS